MNWYYCNDGSNVVGPLPGEAIDALRRCGTINDDTPLVAEGSTDWKTFGETFKRESSSVRKDVPDLSRARPDRGMETIPATLARVAGNIDLGAFLNWAGSRKKALGIALVGLLLASALGSKIHSKIERERAGREFRERAAERRNDSNSLTFTADTCSRCSGTGVVKNTFVPPRSSEWVDPDSCRGCNGEGTFVTRSGHSAVCQDCGGRGVNPTRKCHDCGGTGRIAR
ncbi:GYF domain-containing protein [Luteolibacter arcticus]|uniref:GYF domain-containing protein n=1 Tax=Luteolibacter arcticus TaxID=1581411 RepID=A0ABT3GGC8_9BACT|nr:GYF domain-containing protein [Luteolibacter arcticus]MCW1922666.1 GYF domain-containing protein [Luteolibacter arcticus]